MQDVVDSMKNMIQSIQSSGLSGESVKDIFQGILAGIKEALDEAGILLPLASSPSSSSSSQPSSPPPSVLASWPALCAVVWWPYHQDNCRSARCTACTPVLLASSQVCRSRGDQGGLVTARCLEEVMGEGVCNQCTGQFISNL